MTKTEEQEEIRRLDEIGEAIARGEYHDPADDECMDEESMKKELYRLYQLDWCIAHGVSVFGIFDQLRRMADKFRNRGDEADADFVVDELECGDEGLCGTGKFFDRFSVFCSTKLNDYDYATSLIELEHDGRTPLKNAYEKYVAENRSKIFF